MLTSRETRALRRHTGVTYQQHNLETQLRALHDVRARCTMCGRAARCAGVLHDVRAGRLGLSALLRRTLPA